MERNILDYPHSVFAVGERPLCVWDAELEEHNRSFCAAMKPEWFINSIAHHLEGLDLETINEIEQDSALALRFAYHHALETFFALLFAAVQAPYAVPAWLALYDMKDLISLIQQMNYRGRILNAWGVARPSWDDLALMFNGTWRDKENGADTIDGFARSWQRLAYEFIDEDGRAEFNSVKHGFRARPGGFTLRVGVEESLGTAAPPEAMQTVGSSKHGSSIFTLEPLPKKASRRKAAHYHMRRHSLNWTPLSTFGKLQILVVSMTNILAALQVRNGAAPGTVLFNRLVNAEDYWKPWSKSVGAISSGFYLEGPGDGVGGITLKMLRERLEQASGFAADV